MSGYFIDSDVYAEGERMVELGTLMKDPNTTIEDLVSACARHGWRLEFRIVGNESDYVRDDEREG